MTLILYRHCATFPDMPRRTAPPPVLTPTSFRLPESALALIETLSDQLAATSLTQRRPGRTEVLLRALEALAREVALLPVAWLVQPVRSPSPHLKVGDTVRLRGVRAGRVYRLTRIVPAGQPQHLRSGIVETDSTSTRLYGKRLDSTGRLYGAEMALHGGPCEVVADSVDSGKVMDLTGPVSDDVPG